MTGNSELNTEKTSELAEKSLTNFVNYKANRSYDTRF
ncbi:hypothetical protein NIES2135_34200 [Leptolyngbya boryana NIES-2135]|jgi:hypothetical protein|uniref:Uncharacterized protein n=1 Tax=Leptolyngbya boryana NIES-2135 TaxID=1973484 RepID=A0A1Z4JIQ1_LEPBY|nr:hypothetical protein NIES2135_34200 [Leptolyngbya boryana NIES-2135]